MKVILGLPSPAGWELVDQGKAKLGGCVIGPESPDWACPACGLEWYDPDDPVRQELWARREDPATAVVPPALSPMGGGESERVWEVEFVSKFPLRVEVSHVDTIRTQATRECVDPGGLELRVRRIRPRTLSVGIRRSDEPVRWQREADACVLSALEAAR